MRELCVFLALFILPAQSVSAVQLPTSALDTEELIKSFLPTEPFIDNEVCRKHSLAVLDGVKNLEIWALKCEF
jgi:hypothetical protein